MQELAARENFLALTHPGFLAERAEKAAMPFEALTCGTFALWRNARRLRRFLSAHPDVDILLTFDRPGAKMATLVAKLLSQERKTNNLPDLRVVHIVHEGHDKPALLKKWPYKNAFASVFDTQAQLRELSPADPKAAGLRFVLPPCIQADAYSRCPQTPSHFRFMVPLPMVIPKDIETVLHAMADLQAMALETRPWEVHIVGEGHLLEPLLALANHLQVAHRLVLLSTPDPSLYYDHAEAFILPTAFGPHDILRIQEAFALGLPLICSQLPGHAEIATDRENALFFPPGQPVALAGAMLRLLQDTALVENLTAHGTQALKQYSPAATVERLLEIFHS